MRISTNHSQRLSRAVRISPRSHATAPVRTPSTNSARVAAKTPLLMLSLAADATLTTTMASPSVSTESAETISNARLFTETLLRDKRHIRRYSRTSEELLAHPSHIYGHSHYKGCVYEATAASDMRCCRI